MHCIARYAHGHCPRDPCTSPHPPACTTCDGACIWPLLQGRNCSCSAGAVKVTLINKKCTLQELQVLSTQTESKGAACGSSPGFAALEVPRNLALALLTGLAHVLRAQATMTSSCGLRDGSCSVNAPWYQMLLRGQAYTKVTLVQCWVA